MGDEQFRLTCDECGTDQSLSEMGLSEVAGVTIYACGCGKSLVSVKSSKDDAEAREISGFRINGDVIGSKVEVLCRRPGARGAMALPPTPGFFQ